jgi:hypothetical protein
LQDSTCSLQRTIQTKDREHTFLSDKLNAHISLFNSVQKEANSVKRAFDIIKRTLNEKEHVGKFFLLCRLQICVFFPASILLIKDQDHPFLLFISVAGLNDKIHRISAIEKDFVGM